jgi:hypothetical protein
VDVSAVPTDRRAAVTENLVAGVRARAYDLLAGPLWECLAVRVDRSTHVLAFAFSHLVIDGTALASFLNQLGDLYREEPVAPPAGQYRDFVEAALGDMAVTDDKLDFWRDRLAPIPYRVPFPTDRPSSAAVRVMRNEEFRSALTTDQVRDRCRRLETTPFLLNAAAYAALVAGAGDFQAPRIVFGSSVARLDVKADEAMVGCFLDCVLFPVVVNGDETLGELVARTRDTFHAARENLVPYPTMMAAACSAFASRRPMPGMGVYDVWMRGRIFDVPTGHDAVILRFGDAAATLHRTETRHGFTEVAHARHRETFERFHIPLLYLNSVDGRHGHLRYDLNLYRQDTVRGLAAAHDSLIAAMAAPQATVAAAYRAARTGRQR